MTSCPSCRAAMISSSEQLALMLMPWTMPIRPAPLVRLTSPAGWPSLAMAAGEMNTGSDVFMPMKVVDTSPVVTSFSIRGRK